MPTDVPHADVALTYLNTRYHDPTVGTFISVDPIVHPAWPGGRRPLLRTRCRAG